MEDILSIRPQSWSADGSTLVFDYRVARAWHIGLLDLEGEPSWRPLLNTEADEQQSAISPDGRWLAYVSDQSGQPEVYVQRFPELGARRQISTDGGYTPEWSPNGDELLYRVPTSRAVMSVSIRPDAELIVGPPEQLFDGLNYRIYGGGHDYSIAPDGDRFLMIKAEQGPLDRSHIVVVQNWHQELLERVPVN